jgi:hypothetical protein
MEVLPDAIMGAGKTTKENIINFKNNLSIKTAELAFNEYPVYINTVATDIIIITNDGNKILGTYNHIYKGNSLLIEIDGKWETWAKVKNKIKTIIFLDDLNLHESVRHLWSEQGFSFSKFYREGYKDKIINELINNELTKVA